MPTPSPRAQSCKRPDAEEPGADDDYRLVVCCGVPAPNNTKATIPLYDAPEVTLVVVSRAALGRGAWRYPGVVARPVSSSFSLREVAGAHLPSSPSAAHAGRLSPLEVAWTTLAAEQALLLTLSVMHDLPGDEEGPKWKEELARCEEHLACLAAVRGSRIWTLSVPDSDSGSD